MKRPKENIPNHNGEPTGERPCNLGAVIAAQMSDVIGARHHENQSTLRRPWQRTLAAYEIRDGGIYLRKFDVRLATFVTNAALLRDTLAKMFDAAHAQIESERDELTKLPKLRKPKSRTRETKK
jgi:hypothetical protein